MPTVRTPRPPALGAPLSTRELRILSVVLPLAGLACIALGVVTW